MAEWPPKDEKKNKTKKHETDGSTLDEKKSTLAQFLNTMSTGGGGKRLQTKIDELTLEIATLEKQRPADDQISAHLQGHAASTKTDGPSDQVTSLSVADQILMLRENNIHVTAATSGRNLGPGTMAALVIDDSLEAVRRRAVHFQKVELQTPATGRYDNSGISYGEFESNLQRHTVTETDLGVGIPGIFQIDGAYSTSSAIANYRKKVTFYFQSSQLISKAIVVFDQTSLAPEFITKVTEACGARASVERVDKLLACLCEYGQFVPSNVMVGGRITLHTSKELNDISDAEATQDQLKLAADATFRASGSPPVDASGKAGRKNSKSTTVKTAEQVAALNHSGSHSPPLAASICTAVRRTL